MNELVSINQQSIFNILNQDKSLGILEKVLIEDSPKIIDYFNNNNENMTTISLMNLLGKDVISLMSMNSEGNTVKILIEDGPKIVDYFNNNNMNMTTSSLLNLLENDTVSILSITSEGKIIKALAKSGQEIINFMNGSANITTTDLIDSLEDDAKEVISVTPQGKIIVSVIEYALQVPTIANTWSALMTSVVNIYSIISDAIKYAAASYLNIDTAKFSKVLIRESQEIVDIVNKENTNITTVKLAGSFENAAVDIASEMLKGELTVNTLKHMPQNSVTVFNEAQEIDSLLHHDIAISQAI